MDIRLENVSMVFNGVTAVNQITITIKEGELVSLLGPSGCGKSTTLMLLSGLYQPSSGSIYFGDKNVTKVEAEKRGIGMVFQNYALYPHLSVLKNIMFPLKMQKVPKQEALERAMDMARLVQIDHLVDRKPGQLSGGQQQRVAIARALVKKPKLLLLDEPLSNLDARLRLEMREEIRRIQQEVGITAVFVTHDQEEALSISDRVMLMKDGIIQQDSHPQEMYRNPVNAFVSKFLGNPPINMLEASFVANEWKVGEHSISFTDSLQQLHIGIRPEDFYLEEESSAFLHGRVTHIETIGRDTLLRCDCGKQSVRALVDPEFDLHVDDFVHLGVKQDKVLYFNGETGERILSGKERSYHLGIETDMEKHA